MIVLDDVLATGGTASAKIELVERLGGVVVGALFVIELTFLHGRERIAGYRRARADRLLAERLLLAGVGQLRPRRSSIRTCSAGTITLELGMMAERGGRPMTQRCGRDARPPANDARTDRLLRRLPHRSERPSTGVPARASALEQAIGHGLAPPARRRA